MGDEEKRENTRVAFQATISVVFADKSYDHCETRDLSLRGVFVEGVRGRRKGDQCRLSLHLSGTSSDLALQMAGEVVRVEEDGVGLHFSEIDLDSFYHLKNIVYFNMRDPDRLQDEFPDGSEFVPSMD